MIFVWSFQIHLFGWIWLHVGILFLRSLTGRKKPQKIGFNIGWVKLMCPKLFSGTLGTWFCFAGITSMTMNEKWWFVDDGGGGGRRWWWSIFMSTEASRYICFPLPLTVPLIEAFPRVRRRWHGHLGPPRNRGALRVGDYDASENDLRKDFKLKKVLVLEVCY